MSTGSRPASGSDARRRIVRASHRPAAAAAGRPPPPASAGRRGGEADREAPEVGGGRCRGRDGGREAPRPSAASPPPPPPPAARDDDYLRVQCQKFLEHASRIPNQAVSRNADCAHFARACRLLERGYRIGAACLRHLAFGQPWREAVASTGLGRTPAARALPSVESLYEARRLLIRAALENEPRLAYNYRIDGRDNRLGDNVLLLVLTLDAVQFWLLPRATRAELAAFVAERDPWLCENNAAIAAVDASASDRAAPVLSYRVSQLSSALYQLAAAWSSLVYSRPLVLYLELLRVRIGQMLNQSYGGRVHDVEALRVGEAFSFERPDGEYQASGLLQIAAPVLSDMFRRTIHFAAQRRASAAQLDALLPHPSRSPATRHLAARLGAWVRDKIGTMMPEGPSEYLGRHLLAMSLRPGERAVYAREFPSGSNLTDEQFVLARYRKNEFNYLSELRHKTFAQVLERELPRVLDALGSAAEWPAGGARRGGGGGGHLDADRDGGDGDGDGAEYDDGSVEPPPEARESAQVVLCLVELIEMYVKATYSNRLDLRDFVIFESQLEERASDLVYVDEPLMVQVFNHFQLVYRGVLYRYDSLVLSFLAWLAAVERDFGRVVRECDLTAWFGEVVGCPLEPGTGGRAGGRGASRGRPQPAGGGPTYVWRAVAPAPPPPPPLPLPASEPRSSGAAGGKGRGGPDSSGGPSQAGTLKSSTSVPAIEIDAFAIRSVL